MKTLVYESDWLASQPFFYHEKTGAASTNINAVIDLHDLEWHPEGFNNYLDFGYSVLEQTPVKHVKFMRHSSRLWRDDIGKLSVEYLDDPVEKWLDYRLSESDIIDLIRERVQKWEASFDGPIILPLSGGYDSRLLAWCIKDKSRIRAFTYGTSANQSHSYEVVYAKKLSEILNIKWEQIPLGNFLQYVPDWYDEYGVSTHAHGMYHIEFYRDIISKINSTSINMLSGIIGDAWAGSVVLPPCRSWSDYVLYGYSHGLCAGSKFSQLSVEGHDIRDRVELGVANRFLDIRYRVVEAMRLKIILLSYLYRLPYSLGINPYSPYLDIDLAFAMLNLPQNRRAYRLWQTEFFQKEGLDLEGMGLKGTRENYLNRYAMRNVRLSPLDTSFLGAYIDKGYLAEINSYISHPRTADIVVRNLACNIPVKCGLWRLRNPILNRCESFHEKMQRAYSAYLTLWPLQQLLMKQAASVMSE